MPLSVFNWINPTDKRNRKICQKLKIDVNSELQLLNSLNIRETESLINEILNAQSGLYFQESYLTDSIDDESIEINPPNIVINEICIVSLQDMKEILEEWKLFLLSLRESFRFFRRCSSSAKTIRLGSCW